MRHLWMFRVMCGLALIYVLVAAAFAALRALAG